MTLSSLTAATSWLRENAVMELPLRLHDRSAGDDGAPHLSYPFWRWIVRDDPPDLDSRGNLVHETPWAFEVAKRTVWEDCKRPHPIRAKGEPRCEMCDDALGWHKTRPVYVRPFAAALARLKHERATSPTWPSPYVLCLALLRADLDVVQAAWMVGHPPGSDDERATVEAQFLSACRKLYSRWASGPLPRRGISEAQGDAEAAA